MKSAIFKGVAKAGLVYFATSILGQNVTTAEREKGLRYLEETRIGVIEATKGLSEAQWKFKPAPDRWSIAEIVEHIALVEEIVIQNVCAQFANAPAGAAGRDPQPVDQLILAKVPDRSTKYQAPPPIRPTGRWTPNEALQHFLAARIETDAFLRSSQDLRGHVVNHPVFGALDGCQWVLAAAGHAERHTKQILEVKGDPNFPAN